jgi:protein ImuB
MGTVPSAPERTCVVWCPDWPVTVACRDDPELADHPVIVCARDGARSVVRAASAQARAAGVRAGLRRREAEARCPGLVAADVDAGAEVAAFERVARAVETFTPRIEIHRPGLLAFPTRGPSRYFGGDAALGARLRDALAAPGVLGAGARARDPTRAVVSGAVVGIADGRFAARLAARRARTSEGVVVVAPGGSAAFLAPFPVRVLGDDDLAGLLERLGLPTLGAFAALPPGAVHARFGPEGRRLHRLAAGGDDRPSDLAPVPPDLAETVELDPPAARVDEATFAAKVLADRLLARLEAAGLWCTRVVVEAETEHGEVLARCWRHDGVLTPGALAERVRWQLDAWLRDGAVVRVRPLDGDVREAQDAAALGDAGLDTATGGLAVLRLVPDEVVAATGRQLGFWGSDQAAADRADRALSRVQGMLGFGSVVTLVPQGGRTPAERVRMVPWGEPRAPARPLGAVAGPVAVETPAWPGTVPGPAPARVFDPPIPAQLVDRHGAVVVVSGRGETSAEPAVLRCDLLPGGGGPVVSWAGPWLHDVRWWDVETRVRCALWQVTIASPSGAGELACLVTVERGRAGVAAVYD